MKSIQTFIKTAFILLLTGLALPALATSPVPHEPPQTLVQGVTDKVLAELSNSGKTGAASKDAAEKAIHELIVPNLDFESMAKLVLRKNWKTANEGQREKFVRAFQELLVNTYTKSLVRFSDEKIIFLPFKAGKRPDRVAVVKSEVKSASGSVTPVQYKLRFKPADGWKVYDIVIEGVSLVTNYRGSFAREINIGGMDHLIKLLEEQNQKNKAGGKA